MQININGLSNRSKLSLDNYINSNRADIVFLQETKSPSSQNYTNYNHYLHPNVSNPTQKGGASILIHNNLTVDRQLHLERDNIDAVFVVVTIHKIRLLMCSVYIPPNATRELTTFLDMIQAAITQA